MNPSHGEPAWQLLAHLNEEKLASLLTEYADEPHAELICQAAEAEATRDDPRRRTAS